MSEAGRRAVQARRGKCQISGEAGKQYRGIEWQEQANRGENKKIEEICREFNRVMEKKKREKQLVLFPLEG